MTAPAGPGSATRVFALLGDPVRHSRSPAFQNAAIRHAGIDAVYVALASAAQDVPALMRTLVRSGGGGNVTVPHKAAAAACLDRASHLVRRTGACNTFWGDGNDLCGENTDVAGFTAAANALLPVLRGGRVLIMGAGGGAAAAVCALLDAGAGRVTLLNRTPARARDLAARLDPHARTVEVAVPDGSLAARTFDLVVNATSLGLHTNDGLPLDLRVVGEVRGALDLVCGTGGETPWVRHARDLGVPAADGSAMLLAQGAAAFRLWFGVEPPNTVMEAALRNG
ncbi:MAG TPA: shikimate dehydrogenase [Longimicrobiales bacterium]|nr:shikimate dehydrogenase [Longimicrobiales bacterium]